MAEKADSLMLYIWMALLPFMIQITQIPHHSKPQCKA